MATKENLIKNAKIIYVDNISSLNENYINNQKEILNYLSDKVYLKVGSNIKSDIYRDDHHYTTDYWYKIFPQIASFLNFNFKMGDFKINLNFIDDRKYNYLYPLIDKNYKITVSPYEVKKDNLDKVIIYVNAQTFTYHYDDFVKVENYYDDLKKYSTHLYHELYKFAHTCSIIDNLDENNGRTILLSCNSHAIPLIPILAFYFKRVIVLDNRYVNFSYHLLYEYENENIESVLMMSPDNDLNKFIEQNF